MPAVSLLRNVVYRRGINIAMNIIFSFLFSHTFVNGLNSIYSTDCASYREIFQIIWGHKERKHFRLFHAVLSDLYALNFTSAISVRSSITQTASYLPAQNEVCVSLPRLGPRPERVPNAGGQLRYPLSYHEDGSSPSLRSSFFRRINSHETPQMTYNPRIGTPNWVEETTEWKR